MTTRSRLSSCIQYIRPHVLLCNSSQVPDRQLAYALCSESLPQAAAAALCRCPDFKLVPVCASGIVVQPFGETVSNLHLSEAGSPGARHDRHSTVRNSCLHSNQTTWHIIQSRQQTLVKLAHTGVLAVG